MYVLISFDGVEVYGLDMYNDVGSFEFLPSFLSTPENSSEISNQYLLSGLSDDSLVYHEFGQFLPNLEDSSITSKERGVLDDVN